MTTTAASIPSSEAAHSGPLVRLCKPSDVPRLVELGRQMHAESVYSFLPLDPRKVAATFLVCSTLGEHFAAVAEKDGEIVGFLIGKLGRYPFCDERLATDLGFFVAPEHRGSTAAGRLMRMFRAWAAEQGARELSMAISVGGDFERIGAFYEGMGLQKMGGIYRERLT